jgi:hypothetical protein
VRSIEQRLRDWLYAVCIVWTLSQMAFGLTQFLKIDRFQVPPSMPFAYLVFLVAYGVRKEVDRWVKVSYKKRRGEYFFWLWALYLFVLYVVEWYTREKYVVPSRSIEALVYAGIVYVGTGTSRILRLWKLRDERRAERRKNG